MANSYTCNAYLVDEIDGELNYVSDKTSILTLIDEVDGTLEVKNFNTPMVTIISELTPWKEA